MSVFIMPPFYLFSYVFLRVFVFGVSFFVVHNILLYLLAVFHHVFVTEIFICVHLICSQFSYFVSRNVLSLLSLFYMFLACLFVVRQLTQDGRKSCVEVG